MLSCVFALVGKEYLREAKAKGSNLMQKLIVLLICYILLLFGLV